jgi:hypothetical protein
MLSREPLAVRAAVVGLLTATLHVLTVTGVLPVEAEAETAVAGVFDAIGAIVAIAWGRSKVTPAPKPDAPAATLPAVR